MRTMSANNGDFVIGDDLRSKEHLHDRAFPFGVPPDYSGHSPQASASRHALGRSTSHPSMTWAGQPTAWHRVGWAEGTGLIAVGAQSRCQFASPDEAPHLCFAVCSVGYVGRIRCRAVYRVRSRSRSLAPVLSLKQGPCTSSSTNSVSPRASTSRRMRGYSEPTIARVGA